MNQDLIFALDIGSERVIALATQNGGVRATGDAPSAGFSKGAITDTDAAGKAIAAAVAKLSAALEQEVGPFTVAISGPEIEAVTAQGFLPLYPPGRAVTRDDVLKVINHSRQTAMPAGREQIQAIPREFRLDDQRGLHRAIGMTGGKLEVVTFLVIAPESVRQDFEEAARKGGITIDNLVYGPLASGLGVLRPEDAELGCMVVDLGAESTDVAVFLKGSLAHGCSVPLGSRMVTSDVSKLLKTSLEEAERLKVESGAASASVVSEEESVEVLQLGQTHLRPMQRRVLCEIIQSRIKEIANLAKQQLERQGAPARLDGGIILTGGGSKLPGIEKVFEEVFAPSTARVAKGDPELSRALGLSRFAADSEDDELAVAGAGGWKDRIRTFWSLLGGS